MIITDYLLDKHILAVENHMIVYNVLYMRVVLKRT